MSSCYRLAQGLLRAVREQDFGSTADAMRGGAPIKHFPSIDLAVAVFARGQAPVWANVLFSREHAQGIVASIGDDAGAVRNVAYLADQRDAQGRSIAWFPESDWARMTWRPLSGDGPHRFVSPYPASLLKTMVAVGVAMAVDARLCDWPEEAMHRMITVSDNDATTELVALLHRFELIAPLNFQLAACGLTTLRLLGTRPDGGWGNSAGAGVGMIHMTAWDSVRLMWLLDRDAPPAPWLPRGSRLVSDASRDRLRAWLDAQALHHVLSSDSLVDVPGWVPGLPPEVHFAHKTGTTENYASDAGIAKGDGRHYLVAVLTNLGSRYSPHERAVTTWRLPGLGAAVDRLVKEIV